MTWKPSLRPDADPFALPLDPRQGYLLSRLDGVTDVPGLAALTGLDPSEVTAILGDLVGLGAIAPQEGSGTALPAPPEPLQSPLEAAGPLEAGDPETTEAERGEASARAASHRQLYERSLHAHPLDERVAWALRAEEPELSAFCFDPQPQVIAALLENPRSGPVQARLVAAHHRTAAGLELLGSQSAYAHDPGVRRALLQNPLLPPGLYRRLWSPRRLLEQYLVAASREAPEQTRSMARDVLRASFTQRGAEERVELILTPEGRSLVFLAGLTIDGHTTALLCRRTYVSTLLIQNIARWSAAPPALITHLRKQDVVRRNAQLRAMLERHPNAS
jgi:hypothetical protein